MVLLTQRRQLLALPLAALAAGCGTSPPVRAAGGRLLGLQVLERSSGRVLDEHRHRGDTWIEGRPGERYALRLVNRSPGRVLVVLSVDGINVINGQSAQPLQTGYVLAPGQRADITGWRKTDSEAAAFYFTALPDSYAARTGRPDDVGVIGAAVFRERVVPLPVAYEAPAAKSAAPATAGAAARERSDTNSADARLGTGHGEREYAPVSRTSFERATSEPEELIALRYDSRANLVAAGVIAAPPRRWPQPQPFPGYVPDPP